MVVPRKLTLGLCLLGLLLTGEPRVDAADDLEYQVKAAFLYNFVKFVEWPAGTFEGATDKIVLCILGEDPFGESLDNAVRNEVLNGQPLSVHRTRDVLEARDCHVAFVPRTERSRQERILATLQGRGVLTVGEADGFLNAGGIIRFVLEQNRVRFDINLAAAERSRLKLSSKLLRLARTVQGPGEKP